jgi:O-glycosyl hydrolase
LHSSASAQVARRQARSHLLPPHLQEFAGFGGAFTEASAINWRKLSEADQAEVIRLYFSSPSEGGLGYTMGRVPINSCDFSPASYTFDDVAGDVELEHFDSSVQHDVDSGMVPMIRAAQQAASARGVSLKLLASPWSPPAWMKREGPWGGQSMTASAKPNGLLPEMQARRHHLTDVPRAWTCAAGTARHCTRPPAGAPWRTHACCCVRACCVRACRA